MAEAKEDTLNYNNFLIAIDSSILYDPVSRPSPSLFHRDTIITQRRDIIIYSIEQFIRSMISIHFRNYFETSRAIGINYILCHFVANGYFSVD